MKRERKLTSYIGSIRKIYANVSRANNNNFGDFESSSSTFMAINNFKGKRDIKQKTKEFRRGDHCHRTGHTILC